MHRTVVLTQTLGPKNQIAKSSLFRLITKTEKESRAAAERRFSHELKSRRQRKFLNLSEVGSPIIFSTTVPLTVSWPKSNLREYRAPAHPSDRRKSIEMMGR